jgi:hypothetical protein
MAMRDLKKSTFVGAKRGSGVWQRIISEMPPHTVYAEPFAGTGHIGHTKKSALKNYFIDIDPAAPVFKAMCPDKRYHAYIVGDGAQWILSHKTTMTADWLLYVDPPYLSDVRSCKKDYYKHEFKTNFQHWYLLSSLLTVPAKVMISGYDSPLYDRILKGWRKIYIPTVKRSGARSIEVVWMNFPEGIAFHDVRFLGKNYRERERIKRKKNRWVGRLKKMDRIDKAVLIDALGDMINKNPDDLPGSVTS